MSWLLTILPAIVFVMLAAICKAIADTLDHHFDTSIFRGKPRFIWDPNQVHRTVKKIFGYPLDAWHIINSVQICCWLLVPMVYTQMLGHWWLDCLALGVLHIMTFNIFYNKVLR